MHPKNLSAVLRYDRLIVLFAAAIICFFLVHAGDRTSSGLKGGTSGSNGETLANPNDGEGSSGPTMIMSYSKKKFMENAIASFMYFVPLIAPTFVDNISSVNNQQQVGIISHKIEVDSESFNVICEFEVLGSGFHMNTFDPAGMIAAQTEEIEKEETLTNLLDYIRFDGEGFGIIEVKGEINGSTRTVTEMDIKFNAKGHESPVTIGLYDVEPEGGEYKFENRSNEIVARVNTLIFKKTEQSPKMGITIASIAKKDESAGILGWVKGKVANLFIKPLKVTKLGNTTMLEFGEALLQKKPAFTFPKAENIKESKEVEIKPKQK